MRLKNGEYTVLKLVHWELVCQGKNELAKQLSEILTRFETTREKTREHNRLNAQARRSSNACNSGDEFLEG